MDVDSFIGLHFNLVSRGKKSVETNNQVWMSLEEIRHPIYDSWGVNPEIQMLPDEPSVALKADKISLLMTTESQNYERVSVVLKHLSNEEQQIAYVCDLNSFIMSRKSL